MIVKKIVIITESNEEEKVLRKILADQEPDMALADESLEWQRKIREKFNSKEEIWCKLQDIANVVTGEEADRGTKLKIKAALEAMKIKTKKVHNLTWWLMPKPEGVLANDEPDLDEIPTPFDEIPHKQTLAEIMQNYKKRK